jgi:glucose-1-phosphate thymidylyltransferase
MHVLAFEDPQVAQLEPITLSRPAFAIHCGTYTLLERLRDVGNELAAVVRPHLVAVLAADEPLLADLDRWQASARKARMLVLLVSARLVPSADTLSTLHELIDQRQAGVAWSGPVPLAALVPGDQLPQSAEFTSDRLPRWLGECDLPKFGTKFEFFEFPHDVLRHHLMTMSDNLVSRIQRGSLAQIAHGVFATGYAELTSHVATDTAAGPIVLGADVLLGPFAYLQGPLFIGPGARVREHASIQQFTSLGPGCKVGGEVRGSIFEAFSNKQHFGYVGHSYVGSFVNLGAGTTTSDLKNTYGPVRVRRDGHKLDTGMQFLGAVVGDFAKTAINTCIYTGNTIGTASFVYGMATENVPSFVNYARTFGQVTEVTVETAATVQARMFGRRGIQQRPCDVDLLRAIHALTAKERQACAGQTGPPQF